MCSSTSQLFQWMTEEMGYFPTKCSGSSRILLSNHDLEFVMQGNGGCLWDHVLKYVNSVGKVQCVRKNILLNRLKRSKFQEIQKNDIVGNKIICLAEVKKIQAKLQKARENIQEYEERVKKHGNELKIAGCRLHYQRNISDNSKRRHTLLRMGGENIQAQTDVFNSSVKYINLERAVRAPMHVSNILHHSLSSSDEKFGKEFTQLPQMSFIPPVPVECKRFLERCTSLAKELLDEKLDMFNKEIAVKNTSVMSDSAFSIDSKFIEFDTPKAVSTTFAIKKTELRSYIHGNVNDFAAQHLYESLLSLISKRPTKMVVFEDDDSAIHLPKIYGNKEEHVNELSDMLLEKLTNYHLIINHDFVAAIQEKVISLRLKQDLKKLMSSIENNLKEVFLDNAMQERGYGLVEAMVHEASIRGIISHVQTALNEMQMEMSNSNAFFQLNKLDEQLKCMENDMVHHRKSLRNLQQNRGKIKENIINNHLEVQKCLKEISSQQFLRNLEYFELLAELPRCELMTFNEYPLECPKKAKFLPEKAVTDSQLLINRSISGGVLLEKEGSVATRETFSHWLEITLGMAPHSSTDHIFTALLKAIGHVNKLEGLARSHFHFYDEVLQSSLQRIPDFIRCIEEDEKKSDENVIATIDIKNQLNLLTEKESTEAESIYHIWSEGKINRCVPDCDHIDGKTFLQWYYELQPILRRNAVLS